MMSLISEKQRRRWSSERGSVTVMTAVLLVGIVAVIGLSIDVSRIYMVRSGLQNAADAAALAAARELNSGTAGLNQAVSQAGAIVNQYGFNRSGVTAPNVTISKVEFAASLNGTWYNGAGAASGVANTIKFVRVTTQAAPVATLFAGKVLGANHVEQRTATAGMSVGLNTVCNFFPIAVALNAQPTPNAQLTLTAAPVAGNNLQVGNNQYVVLSTSNNGCSQIVTLAAGITTICAHIGTDAQLWISPSGNSHPDWIANGANSRFDIYSGCSGGPTPATYPPDTNVAPGLTGTQYLNKSPLIAPLLNPPGQDNRRILIMPIITPATYAKQQVTPTTDFGAFLLRSSVPSSGNMLVEYLGNGFVIGNGYYDPNVRPSSLNKPVLYK